MNKKFLFTTFIVLIFFSYIFNIDKKITNQLSILNFKLQNSYVSTIINIEQSFNKYFNQATHITQLQNQTINNEKTNILYSQLKNTLASDINISLDYTKVISYVNFNDFSKVTLDKVNQTNPISALVTKDNHTAGVMIIENNTSIGYLNHNPKCNYAVFIGANKVPGITHGIQHQDNILIKFIPLWETIEIGDEVITSGMDNIFPKDIKVGKVLSVTKTQFTQEAIVKPYANVYSNDYFYILNNKANK